MPTTPELAHSLADLRREFASEIDSGDIRHIGIYNCRRKNGTANGPWSEHCLTGDTEVITRDGLVPIAKLADLGSGEILTRNPMSFKIRGRWAEAPFRSYGEAQTFNVQLSQWGIPKTIGATATHRWYVIRGRGQDATIVEAETCDLRVGDRLANVTPRHITKVQPSPFGVMAGFIFGDGWQQTGNGGSSLRLWGDKNALRHYFPEYLRSTNKTTPGGVEGVEIAGFPRLWKMRPSLSESTAYLAGWLAGYVAADGGVGRSVTLSSVVRDDLDFVRVVASRLGIATSAPRQESAGGYGGSNPTWVISFVGVTVPDWLLLLPSHRDKFQPRGRMANWKVEAVTPRGVEEVFCAMVADTGAFALGDWILTGNSWGNAADIMLRNWPGRKALGDRIAAYMRSRPDLWSEVYWQIAAHYDHVHGTANPRRNPDNQQTPPCAGGGGDDDVEDVVKGMQRSLNAAGFKGANGKTLTVDGIWGTNTEHAFTAMCKGSAEGGQVGPPGPAGRDGKPVTLTITADTVLP